MDWKRLSLMLLMVLSVPAHAESGIRPTVLVLMSYHQNYVWEASIVKGIESVWPQNDPKSPHVVLEWMDTKRHPEPAYTEYFHQFFGQKYQNQKFDLILTGDDNALRFVGDNPQWFAKTPVVFSGINGDPYALVGARPNVTGILEYFNFSQTLKLALKLHPDSKKLVLMGGQDESDKGVFAHIAADLRRMTQKEGIAIPPTTEWRGLTQTELGRRLDGLSADTITFVFGTLRADQDNALMDPRETVAFVRAHSQGPIYSDTDSTLGSGVLGGYFNDGFGNGVAQAEMAKQIIEGVPARNIPIVTQTPYRLAFDANELERFDVSDSDLPTGADLINRPKRLFDAAYRPYLIGSVAVVVVLLLVLLIVFYIAKAEKRQRKALLAANLRDELTGLHNRSGLAHVLKKIEAASDEANITSVALIMLGLRRFKMINDSYGQGVGDQLLVAVCQRISRLLPTTGDFARVNGDVFSVVYRYQHSSELDALLTQIQQAFETAFVLERQSLLVRMSCGYSSAPSNQVVSATLVSEAETAMHTAKKENVQCLQYDPKMHADMIRDREIEEMLPQAMRDGAISMEYQAVRNVERKTIVGYEALARWRQSQVGMILPNDFVRVATESGHIGALTRYVLRKSCSEFHALLKEDPNLYLAVNVSVADLYRPDFCQQLDQILDETQFPAQQLVLEVTEDMSLNNVEVVRAMLVALRGRGVRVSIDDFGTGYSSMRYLSSYTINTLKIDRSFVQDITENETNQTIVRAVVSMANDLGVSVITEGVENMEQVRLLYRLGCVFIQGFVFSRPQPLNLSIESHRRDHLRAELYAKILD